MEGNKENKRLSFLQTMETTKKLRNRILEVALRDEMGHIPSALSILDLVRNVYDIKTDEDQFVLSKGHGCMALYAVLESKGLINWDSKLMGHPLRGGPILASTGSLGHGLPMAVGLALAKKIKGENGRVFCLIGDGECNEGTVWESLLLANHHYLDNLVVIVDDNGSSERALRLDNPADRITLTSERVNTLADKFHAFGFSVWEVFGHSDREIKEALGTRSDKPLAIIADTIKGYGVDFMRGDNSWHNRKITADEYNEAIK